MQNFSDFWKTFTIWREESVSQTNRKTMRIFFVILTLYCCNSKDVQTFGCHTDSSRPCLVSCVLSQHTFGEMMKPFIEWDMRSLTLSLKLIFLCFNFKERKNRNKEVDFSKTKFLEEFSEVWTRENCVTDLPPLFPRSSKVGTLWTYAPPMAAICIEQYWNWQLSVWMISIEY